MERTGYVLERISVKITALLLISSLLFCSCKKENREIIKIGNLIKRENAVYYKNFKSLVWEDARENIPLFKGDYIRTGHSSLAVLQIGEEVINIEENTLIRIDERRSELPEDIDVEIVLLNGDITIEKGRTDQISISVVRIRDGKREEEDIANLVKRVVSAVPDIPDVSSNIQEIGLIYPCNDEVVTVRNPVMRWEREISGILRIYDSEENISEFRLSSERSKRVDLRDGVYRWGLYRGEDLISSRCSFTIRSETESMKLVSVSKGRQKVVREENLEGKTEEILPDSNKETTSKKDIAKKRLVHIQSVISKSIEDIANTRKGIDVSRVRNYAEVYRKLDELNSLLAELKILQESLLIEIIKLESPSMISSYLNELQKIEDNLKDINKEIRDIEKIIRQ